MLLIVFCCPLDEKGPNSFIWHLRLFPDHRESPISPLSTMPSRPFGWNAIISSLSWLNPIPLCGLGWDVIPSGKPAWLAPWTPSQDWVSRCFSAPCTNFCTGLLLCIPITVSLSTLPVDCKLLRAGNNSSTWQNGPHSWFKKINVKSIYNF